LRHIKDALPTASAVRDHKYALLIALVQAFPALPPAELRFAKTAFERTPFVPLDHELAFDRVTAANQSMALATASLQCIRSPSTCRECSHSSGSSFGGVGEVASARRATDTADNTEKRRQRGPDAHTVDNRAPARAVRAKIEQSRPKRVGMKSYERSVRHGYDKDDLRTMLQLAALCRFRDSLLSCSLAIDLESITKA
jgi:hypothetical protein